MTLRSVESGSLVVGQASTASAAGCWNLESSLALGVYADASVAPITQTISARTFIWRDRRAKRERDVSEQFRVGVYQRTMPVFSNLETNEQEYTGLEKGWYD